MAGQTFYFDVVNGTDVKIGVQGFAEFERFVAVIYRFQTIFELVGDFDENGLYQPIQSVGQLSYNSQSYAAQTYYYEPGKPVIRFAWNRSDIPGAPFSASTQSPLSSATVGILQIS